MALRGRESTQVRQEQITLAALRMIGDKGIRGATTAEIAAAAGISEGNLYRHFRNKDEVIKSVIDKIGSDLASILESATDSAEPLDSLEAIFKRHLSYIEEHVGIPRTIFTEEVLVLNESLRSCVRSNLMAYFRGVRAVIERGQKTGVINRKMNPDAVTTMLIGTINFSALRWIIDNFSSSLAGEAERLWEAFARSIRAEP